ncbi:MAG: hypothetical protein VKL41_10935 [Snowella sp.]|nr:hypothetical protein [Snowella sp.]
MSNKNKDKQYQSKVQELSHNIRLCLPQTLLPSAIQFRAFRCVDSAVTNLVSDSQALSSTLNWLKFEKENDGIFGTILSIGYIELLDQEFNRLYLNKEEAIQYILSYCHQQNYRVSEKKVTESLQSLNQYIFQIWPSSTWQSKSLENLIILSTNNWLSITNEICKMIWFKINGSSLYKEYQVLAEFFEKISESPSSNRLSALFYHLSQGEIPTSVWNKCRFDLDQTLPTVTNLDVIKRLARSANQNTPITNSFPALPPASTSDELNSQDSQELTIEDKALLAVPIFWLKFLPFLRDYDELVLLLHSYSQETTPVTPPSPVTPNHQTSPTKNRNTQYEAILYGIPVKRKLTLLEKLQRYFEDRFSLLFGLLFKSHQLPASGLILLALALLAGTGGYKVKDLQMSHCKSPNLASTVISKIPLIGVNCPEPPSPEELTIAALNKIVKDSKDYLKVNENESQATIIELLDSTGKTYNLDFQQIDPPKWLFWHSSPKAENLSNWTTAIQNYQQQAVAQQQQAGVKKQLRLKPTGEIKPGDPTDKYLRCELQKDLQLNSKPDKIEQCQKYGVTGLTPDPSNSSPDPSPYPSVSPTTSPSTPPKPPKTSPAVTPSPTLPTNSGSELFVNNSDMSSADWLTTSTALDALQNELVQAHKDKKLTPKQVEDAIIQALSLKADYKYKNSRPELWIKGIQKFQEKTNSFSSYGSITKSDYTYNLLKCEVAKNLKIPLKNPPTECSSTPTP